MRASRIFLAWLFVVGVDLFFNAGLFAGLFDQSREPALLPDKILFKRIPVAYLALAVSVAALAWLIRRLRLAQPSAVAVGGFAGLLIGVQGLGALWTAIDMTASFVLLGIFVFVMEGLAAGYVLSDPRPHRIVTRNVLVAFVVLVVLGQVAANLLYS